MKIGELARKAGVSIQTLRYYERRRLLRRPRRTCAGYRLYDETDLSTVRTIKQLQGFRFTLKEIRRVLQLYAVPGEDGSAPRYPRGSHRCLDEAVEIGDRKLKALDEEIHALASVREALASALDGMRLVRR